MTDRDSAEAGGGEPGSSAGVRGRGLGGRASGLGDREPDLGGDPACWLNRVCDACGRFVDDPLAEACPICGAPRDVQR